MAQKIRAIVSNKVAMAEGPVAMDVGRVDERAAPRQHS